MERGHSFNIASLPRPEPVQRVSTRNYPEAAARTTHLAIRGLIADSDAVKRLLEARLDDLRAGARLLSEKEFVAPDGFPPINHVRTAAAELRQAGGG